MCVIVCVMFGVASDYFSLLIVLFECTCLHS